MDQKKLETRLENAGIRISKTVWELPIKPYNEIKRQMEKITKKYAEDTAKYLEKRRILETNALAKNGGYVITY
jgi:hypothetical protein